MSPDVLIVAPTAGGHHAEYLRWITRGLAGRDLEVAVAAHPALLDLEDDVLNGAAGFALEVGHLEDAGSLWEVGRATAALIRDVVEKTQARRVFVPYLDHAQLGLATGLRFGFETRISGILLRAAAEPDRSLRGVRKAVLLRLAARNPHLETVLALDPDAVAPLRRAGLEAAWLPDPVEPPRPSRPADEVRADLGLEAGRRMLLLFGSLEERKGVFETLAALEAVPAEAARRLAVVVAGTAYDALRPRLDAALESARRTEAQVVFREGFVSDGDLDAMVCAADAVLALYRGHVGSSGVVLRAAAAGRPLIATDEGMIGREVRAHRLGQTVDVSDRVAVAAALGRATTEPGAGFVLEGARAYAQAHSVGRFVDTIVGALDLE